MRNRDERRANSTIVRKRCATYWVHPDGFMRCANYACKLRLHPDDKGTWEADHEVCWEKGGSDHPPNVRPLCIECHKHKTSHDATNRAKDKRLVKSRQEELIEGFGSKFSRGRKIPNGKPLWPKGRKISGSKGTGWAKRYDRTTKQFQWQKRGPEDK